MQVGIRHFQRVEQKVEALTVGHPRFRLIKFIEAVVPVDLDLVVQDAITSPSYQVQQLAHLLLGQKSIKQMQFDQLWSTQHLKNTVIWDSLCTFGSIKGWPSALESSIVGISKRWSHPTLLIVFIFIWGLTGWKINYFFKHTLQCLWWVKRSDFYFQLQLYFDSNIKFYFTGPKVDQMVFSFKKLRSLFCKFQIWVVSMTLTFFLIESRLDFFYKRHFVKSSKHLNSG